MAYYCGTTHQNVTNYSSVYSKTLRDFLGIVRSAAHARIIRSDVDATVKGAMRILVTELQRRVRTEWNVDPPTSKWNPMGQNFIGDLNLGISNCQVSLSFSDRRHC
ncbi:UNVERIFIED_CONTAM: hypothetical protein NCL1_50452 [Trichonephila clavipes]